MSRRVAMVGFPDAQILDVTGPLEVFSAASRVLRTLRVSPADCRSRFRGMRR